MIEVDVGFDVWRFDDGINEAEGEEFRSQQ
jgi:hypothetical protein